MRRQRGRRGQGTVVKRPDGRYQAQWSDGRDAAGRRIRRSATFTLRRDAEWWLHEAERGNALDTDYTVADWFAYWLDVMRPTVRGTTLQGYEIHARLWIVPQIGHVSLLRLSVQDCERVRDAVLVAGRTRRTAQSVVTTLRMSLAAAVRSGQLNRNVAEGVRLPRREWSEFQAMTPERAHLVMDAFHDHPLRPIVVLAMGSGLRLGELLALRWTDMVRDYVRVTGSVRPIPKPGGGRILARIEPKTERSIRAIYLDQFVLDELTDHHRRQAEHVLSTKMFPGRGDEWRDPTAVRQTFQRVLAAHGLPRMRFHDLRHAYATLALASGVPIRTISQTLGHSSILLTAGIYAHVLPEAARAPLTVLHRETPKEVGSEVGSGDT